MTAEALRVAKISREGAECRPGKYISKFFKMKEEKGEEVKQKMLEGIG